MASKSLILALAFATTAGAKGIRGLNFGNYYDTCVTTDIEMWDPEANAAAMRGILPELEDLCRVMRQVFGATHPGFRMCQNYLSCAQGRLAGQPCMTKRGDAYTLVPAVRDE